MKESTPPTELTERFGKPTETAVLADRATAWVWEIDPEGQGVAVARSVASAVECVVAQIDQILGYAVRHDLRIRQVIVSTRLDGNRRFHERPDLMAVEAAIEADPRWCEFVMFTDVHRVSRAAMGLLLFRSYLREQQVKLVLTSTPNLNDTQLDFLVSLAETERADMLQCVKRQAIRRHEYDKFVSRGTAMFGFARRLEVDPDQWEYVQFIFERIDNAPAGEPINRTLHLICNQLSDAGVSMTPRRLCRIVSNRIYTGERAIRVAGVDRTLSEFELPDPIPADVFERVNARLRADDELE